jgi:hypothetical protein
MQNRISKINVENKMKINKFTKKQIATTICLLLLISTVSLTLLPSVDAHSPPWTITTHAFITVNPNPVGIGQPVNIVVWAGLVLPSAAVTNDIRFHDYKVIITKPDSTTETISWPVVTDTTSTAYSIYTPNQVGQYSFVFSYPDQKYVWSGTYQNDTYRGDTSKTLYLTVQEEPLPAAIKSYPMPTEYWTRPIEGQNTDWYKVSSNWLGYTHPSIIKMVQPDGSAPNSAHVMWTKRIDEGGVVGGTNVGIEGNAFYSGTAYNPRFAAPIIMSGRLYYELPLMNSNVGGGWMCVDLRTGAVIWYNDKMGTETVSPSPSFGYQYDAETENQHGVVPAGILFSSNFGVAYDAVTGQRLFNVTNVPSGTSVVAPHGEILRYQIDLRNGWIAQWNSSRLWTTSGLGWAPNWNVSRGWVNASTTARYDWNVTIPKTIPTSASPYFAIFDDIILGSTSFAGAAGTGTPDPYTQWAISLKPNSRGTLLWIRNYTAPPENVTRFLQGVDTVNRATIFLDKETFQFLAYSIDTGEKMWETTPTDDQSDFSYFDVTHGATFTALAYGRVYNSGFGGVLYCYDSKDGKLLWTYGNGGEGNSTNGGLATPWGRYPLFIASIADDKVFLFSGEHSPNTPLYKGLRVRGVNATTGEELWTMLGSMGYPPRAWYPVADGFVVYHNLYDGKLYSIGKGPSATTVEAPMTANTLGESIVIRGTVMDISAGTKQDEQAARFPNGVPAVSDKSQGDWMEYVYMQKPRPTSTVGVPVTISVIDANDNYRDIGLVTTNADGFFSLTWKPDIEGDYTAYASFGGSESYWPSHAVTSFSVDPAAPTPEPTEAPQQTTADLYLLPGIAAIIVVLVIGFVATILVLRKRP